MATGVRVRRECEWIRRLLGKGGKKGFIFGEKTVINAKFSKGSTRFLKYLKIFTR